MILICNIKLFKARGPRCRRENRSQAQPAESEEKPENLRASLASQDCQPESRSKGLREMHYAVTAYMSNVVTEIEASLGGSSSPDN